MDLPLKVTTRLYDSIDMPLSVWIDALVDGNTDKIKDFGDRFAEFCEAIGGRELMIQLDNIIEMTQLRTKIQIAELCMNQLRIMPDERVFDILYGLGYPSSAFEYSPDIIEKYIAQIMPYVKLDSVDLQVMVNRANKGNTNKVSYSRDYFTDMLIEISTAFKVAVTQDMTVRTYCRWVVKYKDYVDKMNKQAQQTQAA